jgi:MFS family permease
MLTTWLSWEWIFLLNVPVGLVAAAGALRLIPATPLERSPGRGALDASGALTVVGGLAALIYGVTQAGQAGWGSTRALVLLAAGAALLATFVAVERTARRPLLPPATWRTRSLASGAGVMLGVTGILVGTFFLNSLYLQGALGWSALHSGLAFLPLVVAIGAAVHMAARLLPRLGSRLLAVTGLGLIAGGALLLAAAPDQAGYAGDLLPALVLVGLGTGLVFPSVSVSAMSEVDHASAGVASGLMTTAHELGAALGVAILSAVAAGAGTLAAGYGRAFLVAGVLALVLGAVAAVAMPAVRPADGAHVPLH